MYKKTVERLIECQDDGIWRATIDDSYALLDTSATVMIGYALAKGAQLGLGGPDLAARAERQALPRWSVSCAITSTGRTRSCATSSTGR